MTSKEEKNQQQHEMDKARAEHLEQALAILKEAIEQERRPTGKYAYIRTSLKNAVNLVELAVKSYRQ